MGNGVSTLVFIAILGFLGYFFWMAASPYYFHDVVPNAPMQTVIGGKEWYFPMGYIEPHYPLSNNQYTRRGETEVWLTINAADFKIIPQDVAKDTLKIGPAIDVILSSDLNPKTKKAMEEFTVLKNQTGFAPAGYGLQSITVNSRTEYITGDTRISCDIQNCTLFTTRIPDLRTAMVFNRQLLPLWQQMIDILAIELQPFRIKPSKVTVFKNFFTLQPVGIQKPPTTPNSLLQPPGQDMPEVTVPTLNMK